MDKVAAKESLMKILADDVFWKYQVVFINRSTKTFAGSSDVIDHEYACDEIMEHNENHQAWIIGTNEAACSPTSKKSSGGSDRRVADQTEQQ